ncbi:MAG TPA: hypothetical protein VHY08_28370 [Bacillota bacterium]|nr:hypothetical protein [Bacillota bacterium]
MEKNVFDVSDSTQKSKPRYTEAENQILFDSWWNPHLRRELPHRLGREISALRSQFSRLLKEKGLSNHDYYKMMSSKPVSSSDDDESGRQNPLLRSTDHIILETFCKHQALGNSRTRACEELQQKLGSSYTHAALKLRFYRMVNKYKYQDEDLLRMGKEILTQIELPGGRPDNITNISLVKNTPNINLNQNMNVHIERPEMISSLTEIPTGLEVNPGPVNESFFYQISSLPDTVHNLEKRIARVEELQRHQLDLRGFIEHLLAVERDLKREDQLMEEIQRLMDENETIKSMGEKDRDRLKKRENELSEVYQILESLLSDFMRLESVSKLASLGDFMHRLEITVDQFGNVLKSKRVAS